MFYVRRHMRRYYYCFSLYNIYTGAACKLSLVQRFVLVAVVCLDFYTPYIIIAVLLSSGLLYTFTAVHFVIRTFIHMNCSTIVIT